MKLRFGFIYLVALVCFQIHSNDAACGLKSCPEPKAGLINVHLVPHSHDDVGWVETIDHYYHGTKNEKDGVKHIIGTVVAELLKDPKRRFIQVETSFFYKWYEEQTDEEKANVQRLVNEGRLEFIGGAWSMNDEAASHYQSIIDQFTVGLKFLNDTFGTCGRPRIGWQIDPFGHSREMASIFAQMGYDGEFFARMDWVEKSKRFTSKEAEMIWKASESLNDSVNIFTGLLYNHYNAPPGFCFDVHCTDQKMIDGSGSKNNIKQQVDKFIAYIDSMFKYHRTSHLIVPMGGDIEYSNAAINFKNIDKLIKYVNERQTRGLRINLMYSTPSCYLNELHKLRLSWPTKTQDFFPYSTDERSYWTGYFTSRPTQKRFERVGNHFLQVTKQLSTLANLTSPNQSANLNKLRHAMGVLQHHDAITGTEKQKVAYDYYRILSDGIAAAQHNARDALRKLTDLTSGDFANCLLLNVSVCEFIKKDANNVVVTLVNPLAHDSTQYVRVPVPEATYRVTNEAGVEVPAELVPVAWQVLRIEQSPIETQHELVFKATVKKMSNYHIKTVTQSAALAEKQVTDRFTQVHKMSAQIPHSGDFIVQNKNIKLTFGGDGHLKSVHMNGITERVEQNFGIYKGFRGNNFGSKRSSGAYIFRPDGDVLMFNNKTTYTVYDGKRVKEVHQTINEWISQVIRIYEGVNRVEFEWLVGPIPAGDDISREIITRFNTGIASNGVFYTDSNGREMLRRVRNKREYFEPNLVEKVSANYYPITARIALENHKRRIALLNDRAQGGSSLADGALELMLHRRLLNDDAFGVVEALNEREVNGKGIIARGKIQLILNSVSKKAKMAERLAQQEVLLPFWKFFSKSAVAGTVHSKKLSDFSTLPSAVHLLTLEPYSRNETLLRFEHFMDHNESNTVSFNIRPYFDALGGKVIRETTLDGNMNLADMKRFKFSENGGNSTGVEFYTAPHKPLTARNTNDISEFSVTLKPMQIRTFIITQW